MKNLTKKILILGLLFNFSNVVNALTCNIERVKVNNNSNQNQPCDCTDDGGTTYRGKYEVTENNGQFTAICRVTK